MESLVQKYSSNFKVLADELRLKILIYLYENGEKCVCDLAEYFNIRQSGISYHLKLLTEAKLVTKKQVAVWNYYALNEEHEFNNFLIELFDKITSANLSE